MYKVNDNIHTYQCTTISAIINQTITWRNTMKEIALCYFASIKPVYISPYRTNKRKAHPVSQDFNCQIIY